MNRQNFISLLEYPEAISLSQTNELEEVLEQYPFFQTAHALRLKGLKDHKSFLYNKALKLTAAHTKDRVVLFEWITSGDFLQNKIAEEINHQTAAIETDQKKESLNEVLRMDKQEADRVLDPQLFGISDEPQKEPMDFDPSEGHSFSEWLKLTSVHPVSRQKKPEEAGYLPGKKRKSTLVDTFITKNPKILPPEKPQEPARSGTEYFPEELMTQTLARVYLEQKKYDKAIRAYKILILKNPEKSGFFADQIRAIEKLQETKSQ